MRTIVDELGDAATNVRDAELVLEQTVRRAHRAGMTNRTIAAAIGRSHPTVARMIERLTEQENTPT